MSNPTISIDDYFKQEGLKSFLDPRKFWDWAQNKIGPVSVHQYMQLLEGRALGEGLGQTTFYDFIAPQKFSLVANCFEFELLYEILAWIEPHLPHKGLILELGCHTGLMSRYFAFTRPNAKIIGIDISLPAIETAQQLARQKDLRNLEYIHADLLTSPDLPDIQPDCIVTGRVLSEVMSNRIRYQLSWESISYPPIDEDLDGNARNILDYCQQILSPQGALLVTERNSDYDRLNRLWQLVHQCGFSSSAMNIEPINWKDVAGSHHTWFFKCIKQDQKEIPFDPLDPFKIPLKKKHSELVENETRILFKGMLALKTRLSLEIESIEKQWSFQFSTGALEHIEVGISREKLGFAFIGSNYGDYTLTLCLPAEFDQMKLDILEYAGILREKGAIQI